ncbi:SDR family NAD(P)-dependent oxidoreductase [Bacillus cereus]|uniref:SDR family NAD(P)-dependent oxidoreductase n=1 Tax=Bacillus cereus TaxID=1396 RepID=UPI00123AB7F4|nr:SDR family NAD(P)-dependent oxidoreductase [Bacillus cereus]KAA6470409.1 SDR family NAD(P)-dependent oxidoreductase [Bacillus cereus]
MNCNLYGKVIVITGASKGIGRKLAIHLAQSGAKIVLNYNNSNSSEIEEYLRINNIHEEQFLLVQGDISKFAEVKTLYERAVKAFGKIDVLINNAGICNDNLITSMTEQQWNQVVDTNLTGTFNCCKIFVNHMINNEIGKIINIASLQGQIGSEGQINYSTSKAGLIGFTKSLAKEVGKHNISVNAVCPGMIVTDLNRNNVNKLEKSLNKSVMCMDNVLEDLLNFILFLSSDLLTCVSGRVFNIDSRIN